MTWLVSEAIHWINRARGNYRCLLCGYQFFDGCPRQHLIAEHKKEEVV